jgi:hypothetical protein
MKRGPGSGVLYGNGMAGQQGVIRASFKSVASRADEIHNLLSSLLRVYSGPTCAVCSAARHL